MATENTQEVLAELLKAGGIPWRCMALWRRRIPFGVEKYNAFIEATYTGERTLDRKTKELLQVAVEAALRADVDQIRAHVRVALREGATPVEILEALQCVAMPMGGLAFRRGLQAWAAETGFSAPEQD